MSVTVNCDGPLVIDRGKYGEIIVKYNCFELRIHRSTIISEINLGTFKSIEAGGEVEMHSGIEIGSDRGVYEFKYSYDLRELASTEFDRLVQFLKPLIKSPSNTNKI